MAFWSIPKTSNAHAQLPSPKRSPTPFRL